MANKMFIKFYSREYAGIIILSEKVTIKMFIRRQILTEKYWDKSWKKYIKILMLISCIKRSFSTTSFNFYILVTRYLFPS